MGQLLWICAAGALGTGARYLVALWAARVFGSEFPYGTLIVNLAGSFLMVGIMQLAVAGLVAPSLRLTLTTGFMGGLTTYSTFNYETLRYLQDRAWMPALANVAITGVGCLIAGVLGLIVARRITG